MIFVFRNYNLIKICKESKVWKKRVSRPPIQLNNCSIPWWTTKEHNSQMLVRLSKLGRARSMTIWKWINSTCLKISRRNKTKKEGRLRSKIFWIYINNKLTNTSMIILIGLTQKSWCTSIWFLKFVIRSENCWSVHLRRANLLIKSSSTPWLN